MDAAITMAEVLTVARHFKTPAGHSDSNTAVEHADHCCEGSALAY